MDCKQFREVLDLHVDGELSPEASASAQLHLSECPSCRRVEQQVLRMRSAVKAAVQCYDLPPALQRRIYAPHRFQYRRLLATTAIAGVLSLAVLIGALPGIRSRAANLLETAAFHLDGPRTVEIEGRVICRDCELKRMYNANVIVSSEGHGALETADGKIWNFMENRTAAPLIQDKNLMGKTVRIRGKIYRRAGCVEVESYEFVSKGNST